MANGTIAHKQLSIIDSDGQETHENQRREFSDCVEFDKCPPEIFPKFPQTQAGAGVATFRSPPKRDRLKMAVSWLD